MEAVATPSMRTNSRPPRAPSGRRQHPPGIAGGPSSARGSTTPPKRCWISPRSAPAAGSSTSPPGRASSRCAAARRVGRGGHVLATDIAPALLERADADAQAEGLAQLETRELDGEALDALPAATFDAADEPRRAHLLSRPAARARRHPPRPEAGRPRRGGRLLDTRAQCLLLDPGEDHPRARQAAAAAARPARALLARRQGRAGGSVRARRLSRRRGPRASTSPVRLAERGRVRALRARIVRRAAPDDGCACPTPTRRGPGPPSRMRCKRSKRRTASRGRARCWSAPEPADRLLPDHRPHVDELGKERPVERALRDRPTPDEPPVPVLWPMMRSTVFMCRKRQSWKLSSMSTSFSHMS